MTRYRYITVNVTAEDIELGEPRIGTSCPIARALRRKGATDAYVGGVSFRTEDYGGWLSRSAQKFMEDFDSGVEVQPQRFRFRLNDDLRYDEVVCAHGRGLT